MNIQSLKFTENGEYIETEMISKNGQKYVVGYPIALGYSISSLHDELIEIDNKEVNLELEAKDFKELEWIPNSTNKTSSEAQKIGIKSGEVVDTSHIVWRYRINFINSSGWKFEFKDQSGDVYSCWTVRNGPHYIDFNSPKPTIIGVRKVK